MTDEATEKIGKMSTRKRIAVIVGCAAAIILICGVCVFLLAASFPGGFNELKYNILYQGDPYKVPTDVDEEWLIGKTRGEIVERYGFYRGWTKVILDRGYEEYDIIIFCYYDDADPDEIKDSDVCTRTHRYVGYYH